MSALALNQLPSPPLAPRDEVIDLGHLARMTLGERNLEREVLALFSRQAEILLCRMDATSPATTAAAAHTLKGSAVGIGAWRVAHAAEVVEQVGPATIAAAIAALSDAVAEATAAIAGLLRTH